MLLKFFCAVVVTYCIQTVCGITIDKRLSSPKSEISILFVILSQNADYDAYRSSILYQTLKEQVSGILNLHADVLRTHEDMPEVVGTWAIWPMIESLLERYRNTMWDWLFICEPDTTVNISALIRYLDSFDRDKKYAIGRGLTDEMHTIIHHFFNYKNGNQFFYPDFAAGLVLSWTLFKGKKVPAWEGFTIDAKHEFARILKDEFDITLNNTNFFCLLEYELQCITRYVQPIFECANDVTNDDVYFAVKTYSEFHKTRIVVVKRTWAKTAKYVEYFSDMVDHYVPTVDLGVPNTNRGHCGKTFAILVHYLKNEEMSKTRWLVVVDDDTLMSVPRLYKLLSCYDASKDLIIGERYGYGFSTDGREGYDYPTGGAGMVFSRKAAEKIVMSCRCPNNDSPDDMIVGMCAHRLRIPVIHSAAFHQAQPQDYSKLYLKRMRPISFHKFNSVDPYKLYMEWLYDASTPPVSRPLHMEL